MVRLKIWQWVILALPIALIIGFLLVAAGWKIHDWGLSWIWAVVTLVLVGWRWLLVHWTRPAIAQVEAALAEISQELELKTIGTASSQNPSVAVPASADPTAQAEAALQTILTAAQADRALWEDWPTFWQRCQELVVAIAQIYYPDVKYPLLNIYIPQAYGLIRGTVDDTDQWMQKLSPALNQLTVGQAYQAYEVYRKLEPSARKLWQAWNWAQWLLNPVAAVARQASQRYNTQANQQLLVNLGQLLRESALRNLCGQAVALYSSTAMATSRTNSRTTSRTNSRDRSTPALPTAKTQTLRDILTQVQPAAAIAQQPVSILLVGRTGGGKSSLINTLFQSELATVDLLPSTDQVQDFHWQTPTGESLTLWDTPGYEQISRADFRAQVLDYATQADLLLLVTPALDPALQMDADFLSDLKADVADLPVIVLVTQVDRLRPIREWQPPYDWQWGTRAKEIAIHDATQYRAQLLGEFCDRVLPVVTAAPKTGRQPWGIDVLSMSLLEAIAPAKQLRLARFLRDLDSRTLAAAKIIDHYTFQMTTTQGLAALVKSPILQFLSTLSTGSPALAYVLAQQIPVEQLPLVIGKLQMAYDLHALLQPTATNPLSVDWRSLWPLLLENPASPDRTAWAWGHALVEYWTQDLAIAQLHQRFDYYLTQI